MNIMVDVAFPVIGQGPIPADHGYLLYAALSRQCPDLHREEGVGVHPIAGRLIGPRQLQFVPTSRVCLRLPADCITLVLGLAGKSLTLAEKTLRLGVPTVQALRPATALRSRLVTTKNGQDAEHFRGELRRQLSLLNVSPEITIHLPKTDGCERPQRRTIRIKGKEIVGHEVILEGLSANESIDVQTQGLGGRRRMGCGVFVGLR